LTEKHSSVYSKVDKLKNEFRTLRQSIGLPSLPDLSIFYGAFISFIAVSSENFPVVFDTILAILNVMTGFMEVPRAKHHR